MVRAQLNIFLRSDAVLTVNFGNDEAVNAVSERLKKSILEGGIFSIDMTPTGGPAVVQFLPSREIVRFSITQFPRVAAAV